MTGAHVRTYVRAHCRSPDAIQGALAPCQSWGNLPRRCITPDRFATVVEPNQSSGAMGLSVTHSQGGAVNRTAQPKGNWPEGICPAPITVTAGGGGRRLPAGGFKKGLGKGSAAGASKRCQAR